MSEIGCRRLNLTVTASLVCIYYGWGLQNNWESSNGLQRFSSSKLVVNWYKNSLKSVARFPIILQIVRTLTVEDSLVRNWTVEERLSCMPRYPMYVCMYVCICVRVYVCVNVL